MKKIIGLFLMLILISAPVKIYAADIKIVINNQQLKTGNAPVILEGRTLVPLRDIAEAMGCEVKWFPETQTINLKNNKFIVGMQIGNYWISKIDAVTAQIITQYGIDVPPILINGVTYIPVRAFAEGLDAYVGWDAGTQSVLITHDTTVVFLHPDLRN